MPQVKYNSNSGYVATQLQPLPPMPPAGDDAAAADDGCAFDGSNGSSNGAAAAADGATSAPLSRASSGVGAEQALRNTPQAFSHFTYVFTRGTALCVDIQVNMR